ncbi:sensor histidine kinase [Streptomyces sp. NPDC058001]|uniref:sensor histidine kinase n=1 Tax=Streptomyces sp. NPDC058001 TaxID=3346300 RepID=UPI0036EE847B
MTETQPLPGPQPSKSRSPEYDHAAKVLAGLRQDLFHDAFAYRPLPPRSPDGRLIRRVPERLRRYAVWTPHAMVCLFAFWLLMFAYTTTNPYGGFSLGVLIAMVPVAGVLLTLLRPVGAFWVSLGAAPFVGVWGASDGGWPWSDSSLIGHLVVLVVVAARTTPRTALWMWLLTSAYGFFGAVLFGRDDSTTATMAFVSAVALLCVSVLHIRREARQEVAAERTVSAVERDKRTLLEERTTIARELHDVVAHHMSVVAIQAEAAPYRVENPPPELEQAFVTIRENAVAALTELRRVLGVVRAEDYEAPDAPQPTLADLDRLLANVRDAGLNVEKVITGAVRTLPPGVELSAYRIVQEALSNSLRHAPGAEARVEVGHVLGGLGLRIVNGPPTGLVKPSQGAGHGIAGMRERVAMLNGEMTAGVQDDGGYEVAVFLPVPLTEEPS